MESSKTRWNGACLLAPVPPVLVTSKLGDKENICTVAWCGILNSKPPVTYISLRPQRYSYEMIEKSGEFVINLPTKSLVRAVDWCGVRSGREQDKFSACGLHTTSAFEVQAPLLCESPLSLECRVRKIEPIGSHHLFLADILAVAVDPKLLDAKGRLHLSKANLLAYAHGEYFELGKKLGSFGYSVRKKAKR